MLDHVTLRVKDLEVSKAFYDKVLTVLGMSIVLGGLDKAFIGYGVSKDPAFELVQSGKQNPAHKNVHVAFKAKDKATVDRFYKAAIVAGAKDNGQPGPRPKYSPTYYACFVIDPDDNNIEACLY
jgi:catechol 2,3-dioxygenase-like lactoylglutathione lyase family enzyme